MSDKQLLDALEPYAGSAYRIPGKYDTALTVKVIRHYLDLYASTLGGPLSDDLIVAGIKKSGDESVARWNYPGAYNKGRYDQSSNVAWVAAYAIIYALQIDGRDATAFQQATAADVQAGNLWSMSVVDKISAEQIRIWDLEHPDKPRGFKAFLANPVVKAIGLFVGAANLGLFGGEALAGDVAAEAAAEFGVEAAATGAVAETFPVSVTTWAEVAPGVFSAETIGGAGAAAFTVGADSAFKLAADVVDLTGDAGSFIDASASAGAVAETFPVSVTTWTEVAPDVFEATTIGGPGGVSTAVTVSQDLIPHASSTEVPTFQKEASKMFEIDYSQDPFATTESVNQGWTEYAGYGVDYYGQPGAGYAADGNSVNDIFGTITKTLNSAAGAIKAAGAAYAATRNAATAGNRAQPNYTRAAGSLNIGMLALAGAAFFALKG